MMRWVSITEASKELEISYSKISRMARSGQIKSEKDPLDSRYRLVDIDEIKAIIDRHDQLRGKTSDKDISTHDKDAS